MNQNQVSSYPQTSPGAVIYTRVSTGEQDKHGTSPETQLDACRKKAQALGLPVIAEYYDGGVSGGFLLSRTEFQAALADIRAGRAGTLICPNISRYSRDMEHQQTVKKAVRAAGGRLVFCDMDFDDTPEGDLAFGIMGGFAEYERKVIRARCIGGHQKKAKSGEQTARVIAPYGYAIPKKADILRGLYPAEMLGKYVKIEEQAAVVREMFARYADGKDSLSSLCRWLNASHVPTPGRATLWGVSVLQYLLQNPVYKGQATYGRFDHWADESRLMQTNPQTGKLYRTPKAQRAADPSTWIVWEVPALVSVDVWEAVNARMSENRLRMSGNPQQVRMLSGRIVCPECGGRMVCASAGRRKRADGSEYLPPPRYVCHRYRDTMKRTGAAECDSASYCVPDVEAAVLSGLVDAIRDPDTLQEVIIAALAAWKRRLEAPKQKDSADELARTDRALLGLAARMEATVQAQVAGILAGLPAEAYNAALTSLHAERKALEDRRAEIVSSSQAHRWESELDVQAVSPDFAEMMEKAWRVLASPSVAGATKRDILGSVIESVICRKGETPKCRGKKAGAEIVFRAGLFLADVTDTGSPGMSSFQPAGKVRDADRDGNL